MKNLSIKIYKARRLLTLWRDGAPVYECKVALGRDPVGHKTREGDGRTPEGVYHICSRNENSKYHLSMAISYPNAADAMNALAAGLIDEVACHKILQALEKDGRPSFDTALGGLIMLHGGGAESDWTAGCVALENDDMDALWAACQCGVPVEIFP